MPVSPKVLLSAIVEMLELLFHHHLLEVEDTLEGGPSGKVRHVMLKIFLVKSFSFVICNLFNAPIP